MFDANNHCHFDPLWADRQRWVATSGLTGMVVSGIGVTPKDIERLDWFSNTGAVVAIGLHPTLTHQMDDVDRLRDVLTSRPAWGVGEIGIDSRFEDQTKLCLQQLQLAIDLDRFVVAHVVGRGSLTRFAQLVDQLPPIRGAIHAFPGTIEQALEWVRRGWMISVGGGITHPGRLKLRRVVEQLPLDSLVVETDAPDLPVAGQRQGRPTDLQAVLSSVATIRSLTVSEVAEATTDNCRRWLGDQCSTLRRS